LNTENLPLRIAEAKNNRAVLNSLTGDYLPFIRKCVSGVFYKRQAQEEHLSEAMLGFLQSVNTYSGERGAFISYAQAVIHNRLVNAANKERRMFQKQIPLEQTDAEISPVEYESAQRSYELAVERENLHAEIEEINAEFAAWGFDVNDLVKYRPKQERSRKTCQKIARAVLLNPAVLETMKRTHQVPVKQLMAVTGFSEKIFEKYRRYIAALVVIESGDYPYIRSFLPAGGKLT
jgi:RNA polymerase sigma factor